MQKIPAFSEITRIKTASFYKLLLWSLAFHLLAIIAFWSEQTSTPLIAGKEHAGEMLSISILSNTSPVNSSPANSSHINTVPATTEKKPLLTKTTLASLTVRHKDSNNQSTPASKSNTQKVAPKLTTPDSLHVEKIKSEFTRGASKRKLREISTETSELLQASLGKRLSEYFHYPRLARKNGWQGQVKLSLRIEGSGRLSNIQLRRSSGYPSLDNAALNSLQKAAYLPDAKSWLQGMHYDIVVPVEYHLIDS